MAFSLPHAKGGVKVGDSFPARAATAVSSLGAFDHLHELQRWSMRPHVLSKSEKSRIVAICTSPGCGFRFQCKGIQGNYIVTKLSPHNCTVEEIVPRKKRIKIAHLPATVEDAISSSITMSSTPGGGGGYAKTVQSFCSSHFGVDLTTEQINRHRRKGSGLDIHQWLPKLQILPSTLKQICQQLPSTVALLRTTALSEQLHAAAQSAFMTLSQKTSQLSNFNLVAERSIESLFFGETNIVAHVDSNVGHGVYTLDACHMHRPSVGYDCLCLSVTTRIGDGKVIGYFLFLPVTCVLIPPPLSLLPIASFFPLHSV